MKHLLTLTTLFLFVAGAALAATPKVSDCFKVHSMVKVDDDHYGANWTNACPYTIDSVYVIVRFSDKVGNPLGNGVWAMHFVPAGTHRLNRFTVPSSVQDFESVSVRRILTDSIEALQ